MTTVVELILFLACAQGAPTITGVTPTPGSTVASPASITITLSANPDPATISNTTVKLIGRGPDLAFGTGDDVVVTPTSVSAVGNTIILDLSTVTLTNDVYRVVVSGTSVAPAAVAGLFGYWKLNEGIGSTAADGSGNVRNGTLNGAGWGTGVFGNALRLNGGGTRVDLDQGVLGPDWSVSMWVSVTANVNVAAATVLDSNSVSGTSLRLEQFSGKDVGITEYTITDYGFGFLVPLQRWIHLTYTSDASNAKLYVNGILSNTAPRGFNLHVDKFGTARTSVSLSPFCLLSEVQIYTRLLTGGEIAALATLSGCVRNVAGNVLDGEFTGAFPSGKGDEGGDFISHFGVNVPAPPAPFALITPASFGTGVALSPLFTWAPASGAASYTLQVATDAAFASLVVNQPGITATSATPATALTNSTLYYWRVTAVHSGETTLAFNAPFSFTTAPPVTSSGGGGGGCGSLGLEFLLPWLLCRKIRREKR